MPKGKEKSTYPNPFDSPKQTWRDTVPIAGHHTKSYFRLSFAHGLSQNRDVSRDWYWYLTEDVKELSLFF